MYVVLVIADLIVSELGLVTADLISSELGVVTEELILFEATADLILSI
jgi:hypothetical protein